MIKYVVLKLKFELLIDSILLFFFKLEIREYVKKYKEAKEEKAFAMKQQKDMEEMMEMEAKRKLAAITLPKFREMVICMIMSESFEKEKKSVN